MSLPCKQGLTSSPRAFRFGRVPPYHVRFIKLRLISPLINQGVLRRSLINIFEPRLWFKAIITFYVVPCGARAKYFTASVVYAVLTEVSLSTQLAVFDLTTIAVVCSLAPTHYYSLSVSIKNFSRGKQPKRRRGKRRCTSGGQFSQVAPRPCTCIYYNTKKKSCQ